jgi:uncharacterized membrane protein YfcA
METQTMNIDHILLLTIGTFALAGFVQSLTGFGFGLVAMALLPLFLQFKEAYMLIIIPNLVVCTMNFAANYRQFQWRQGLGLIIGSCIAVPLGFYTMLHMKSDWLMFGLGLLICVFASSELLMSKTRPLRLAESLGTPLGVVSGTLSGAFNMGGPPAVAYVYSQNWAKEHIVALLQIVFGTSSIIRLALMQGTGHLTRELLRVSLLAIIPLLLAIVGGNKLLRKIKREHLRVLVFIFLLIIGVKYIFKF